MYQQLEQHTPLADSDCYRDDSSTNKLEEDADAPAPLPPTYKRLVSTRAALCILLAAAGLTIVVLLAISTAPRHSGQPCASPSLRQEWRQLNSTEKTAYIDTVKCLQGFPSNLTGIGRRSDDFPWVHRHVATSSKSVTELRFGQTSQPYSPSPVHDTALFLPYHRYLLHLYENSLRELCNYSGTLA